MRLLRVRGEGVSARGHTVLSLYKPQRPSPSEMNWFPEASVPPSLQRERRREKAFPMHPGGLNAAQDCRSVMCLIGSTGVRVCMYV